jgi:hypothetical protein
MVSNIHGDEIRFIKDIFNYIKNIGFIEPFKYYETSIGISEVVYF